MKYRVLVNVEVSNKGGVRTWALLSSTEYATKRQAEAAYNRVKVGGTWVQLFIADPRSPYGGWRKIAQKANKVTPLPFIERKAA